MAIEMIGHHFLISFIRLLSIRSYAQDLFEARTSKMSFYGISWIPVVEVSRFGSPDMHLPTEAILRQASGPLLERKTFS